MTRVKKLRYRSKLGDMPSYDVVEREWKVKVNANECGMNLPPMVEDGQEWYDYYNRGYYAGCRAG